MVDEVAVVSAFVICHAVHSSEFRVHGDRGVQQFRDGTAGLGFAGKILEGGFVDAWNAGRDIEVARGDGKTTVLGFERDDGASLDLVWCETSETENHGEGHRETARVCRSDEFFWIRSLLAFEAGFERVRFVNERARAGAEGAGSFFEGTLPLCGCFLFHVRADVWVRSDLARVDRSPSLTQSGSRCRGFSSHRVVPWRAGDFGVLLDVLFLREKFLAHAITFAIHLLIGGSEFAHQESGH